MKRKHHIDASSFFMLFTKVTKVYHTGEKSLSHR